MKLQRFRREFHSSHIEGLSSMLFRVMTFVLAFVLACQAIWLLIAEFYRPSYPRFPQMQKPEAVAGNRNAAALAASFGVLRGDLWTEYSLTYLNLFWGDGKAARTKLWHTGARTGRCGPSANACSPRRAWLACALEHQLSAQCRQKGHRSDHVLLHRGKRDRTHSDAVTLGSPFRRDCGKGFSAIGRPRYSSHYLPQALS